MLMSVRRLVWLRRLSYGCMWECDAVLYSPSFVTATAENVTTVAPRSADERLSGTSSLRTTAFPAFSKSTYSLCFGGPLCRRGFSRSIFSLCFGDSPSKSGLGPCLSGRNLLLSNATVLDRYLHQKADEKLEATGAEDVGEKVDKEAKEVPLAEGKGKLSQKERLKRAVREYGATVIVFHTCISLFTLGVSYAVVSSGVDVVGLMSKIGVGQSILESKLATGASTFVMAYAVHKVFAPARIACTLTATPFIVRYLRKIGFLKAPIPKS